MQLHGICLINNLILHHTGMPVISHCIFGNVIPLSSDKSYELINITNIVSLTVHCGG